MSHLADFKTALDALCQHYGTQVSLPNIAIAVSEKAISLSVQAALTETFARQREEFARRVEADRRAGRLPF